MKVVSTLLLSFFLLTSAHAQINLALQATASASASSTGNFGPANWNDGIINGTFFGWVGTAATFTQPAWMQLEWPTAVNMNRMVLYNVGTNFQPPTGNGVIFSGQAFLQFWTGSAWQNLDTIWGSGTYGDSVIYDFPTIQSTRLRLHQINTFSGPHNPGFDEWRVYFQPTTILDASIDQAMQQLILAGSATQVRFSFRLRNLGKVPIVNPVIIYDMDTSMSTGPFPATFPLNLAPGADTVLIHPQNQPAIRQLNGKEVCFWINLPNDVDRSNDTSCLIIANIGASLAENDLPKWQLYPNPVQSEFQIIGDLELTNLRLFDLQGRQYFLQDVGEGKFALPPHAAPGIYLLELKSANLTQYIRLVHQP